MLRTDCKVDAVACYAEPGFFLEVMDSDSEGQPIELFDYFKVG
jgi:hypothetical protein